MGCGFVCFVCVGKFKMRVGKFEMRGVFQGCSDI